MLSIRILFFKNNIPYFECLMAQKVEDRAYSVLHSLFIPWLQDENAIRSNERELIPEFRDIIPKAETHIWLVFNCGSIHNANNLWLHSSYLACSSTVIVLIRCFGKVESARTASWSWLLLITAIEMAMVIATMISM